jgi:ParB-like chromosome segregation protein Spo0J
MTVENRWRNRIVGSSEEVPGRLIANDKNWRLHTKPQREALLGAIADVGFIRSVTVNKRSGRVVDGHLRVLLAVETHQETIPVEWVDLSPQEEAAALATLDPLSALAEADREKLGALLQEVRTRHPAVSDMLRELAQKTGIPAGTDAKAGALTLPPEKFEVLVECADEEHQREVYDRRTGEGLRCRVLMF